MLDKVQINRTIYKLERHDSGIAMYSLSYKEYPDKIIGFDVFVVNPDRFLPRDEDYGRSAFSWSTKDAAEKCFEELKKKLVN